MEEKLDRMLEKLNCILELARDVNFILKRIDLIAFSVMMLDSKIVVKVDIVHDTDVDASVEYSPLIPDDTPVHESSTSDFEHETEVDSTMIPTFLVCH